MPSRTAAKTSEDKVRALIEGFSSPRASVRFRSSKALDLLAEEAPEAVYPHIDFLLGQLDSPNSILRWNATHALAALARVDGEGKLDAALDKYLSPIRGPQMIGAATAMQGAAEIALAKPYLSELLAQAILGVRHAVYEREECHNVAAGHAMKALERFYGLIEDKAAVRRFVRAQLENPRPATRAKAQAFLKKHGRP
jgi:HEAT repeat protein